MMLQEFQRRGADQRTAAERGSVHSRRKRRRELLVGENRAERQAARERLGYGDDVRKRVEFLVGETAAGAAQAALNFVGDQRGIVLRGEFARALSRILR